MKKCESVIDQTNDNLFPKYEPDQQELKLYNKECSRKKKTLMSIFDDEGRVDTYELFMLINEYSQASIERMLSSFIKNVERNAFKNKQLWHSFRKTFRNKMQTEQSKVGNRMKRILMKLCANRTHVPGVNGNSKFFF